MHLLLPTFSTNKNISELPPASLTAELNRVIFNSPVKALSDLHKKKKFIKYFIKPKLDTYSYY